VKKTNQRAIKAAIEAAKNELLLENSAGFIEAEGDVFLSIETPFLSLSESPLSDSFSC
jgi:hypothetical protein